MRICENGVYRDATAEEVAAWEAMRPQDPGALTLEGRVADIESALEKGMRL